MIRRLGPALFSWSNLVPLLATLVYLINRFAFSLDCVLPYEFANYHLTDLCGGIVFPARLLSPFSSISSTSAAVILPSPAATSVPAMILTML